MISTFEDRQAFRNLGIVDYACVAIIVFLLFSVLFGRTKITNNGSAFSVSATKRSLRVKCTDVEPHSHISRLTICRLASIGYSAVRAIVRTIFKLGSTFYTEISMLHYLLSAAGSWR